MLLGGCATFFFSWTIPNIPATYIHGTMSSKQHSKHVKCMLYSHGIYLFIYICMGFYSIYRIDLVGNHCRWVGTKQFSIGKQPRPVAKLHLI